VRLILLAAGYATRLYPLTLDRPKPLLPVGGRPMIDWLLDSVDPIGFDVRYVVTNSKFAEQFRGWAGGRGDLVIVDDGTTSDDDRLGAIGDIGYVIAHEAIDDDLVVVAGDNLFSEGLDDFGRAAREGGSPLLAIHDVGDVELIRGRYNSIAIDEAGRITYFEEKPDKPRSSLSGIALYFYPRWALPLISEYLASGENPDQPGRLVQWLYPRTDVYTWRVRGDWYDIGSREQLAEADRVFSARRSAQS
jgi:glucose-1-phosphate thymidylyltransferase